MLSTRQVWAFPELLLSFQPGLTVTSHSHNWQTFFDSAVPVKDYFEVTSFLFTSREAHLPYRCISTLLVSGAPPQSVYMHFTKHKTTELLFDCNDSEGLRYFS